MKISHYRTFPAIDVNRIEHGAEGVTKRRVISEVDGAENVAMDILQIAPGGHTPFHSHPWEHQVFVISGSGLCRGQDGEHPFHQGDVMYIAPNEPHQLENTGTVPLEFVCVAPC